MQPCSYSSSELSIGEGCYACLAASDCDSDYDSPVDSVCPNEASLSQLCLNPTNFKLPLTQHKAFAVEASFQNSGRAASLTDVSSIEHTDNKRHLIVRSSSHVSQFRNEHAIHASAHAGHLCRKPAERSLSNRGYQSARKVAPSPYQSLIRRKPQLIEPKTNTPSTPEKSHLPPSSLSLFSSADSVTARSHESSSLLVANCTANPAAYRTDTYIDKNPDRCSPLQQASVHIAHLRRPLTRIAGSERLHSPANSFGFVHPLTSRKTSAPPPPSRFDSWQRVQQLGLSEPSKNNTSKERSSSCPNLFQYTVVALPSSSLPAPEPSTADTQLPDQHIAHRMSPLREDVVSPWNEDPANTSCWTEMYSHLNLATAAQRRPVERTNTLDASHDYWLLESRSPSPALSMQP